MLPLRHRALRAALPAAVAALLVPIVDAVPAAAAAPTRVAADATVPFEVSLDLQDEAGAEALATAVSTPGDAQFRHFLAPADWIARFAPAQAAFDATVADLAAAGLTVAAHQPADREYVLGSGPAGLVARYFSTRLETVDPAGAGRVVAATAPELPSVLRRRASSVSIGRTPARSLLVRPDARVTGTACSGWWGQHEIAIPRSEGVTRVSTPLCGYTPTQLREVTGLDAAHGVRETGSGVTVAVLDAFGAPGMAADLATFSARHGLPGADYRELVPDQAGWTQSAGCRATDWQPEQALDLEAAHSVAPRATLLYVGAADCDYGLDLALSTVLDGGLADVVSSSFGGDESLAGAAEVHAQLQAAAEGVALVAASGDQGDERALTEDGSSAVGFPASSPWVTAVGGTTVALDAHGRRVFETAWGDHLDSGTVHGTRVAWAAPLPGDFAGGAGGGASTLFDAPRYQSDRVPTTLSRGARTVSDVSALAASATGFRIGYRPDGGGRWTEAATGGTSLASPIVAAEVALAEQRAGHRLGFLNPVLYASASTFRDVRPSSARRVVGVRRGAQVALLTLGTDTSLALRRGYDEATGLGELAPATIAALARG